MEISPDFLTTDGAVGVAVSGGSDSIALLLLGIRTFGKDRVKAATVDHGLRPAATQEARDVAALCGRLGVAHTILEWREASTGNLQASARYARYDLLAKWASQSGLEAVLLGHTQDDQAETVLLQMQRKAGLTGLAGMRPRFEWKGVAFLRPLLDRSRSDLRALVSDQGQTWIDDPSNDNLAFNRVRVRKALPTLAKLGIGAAELAGLATRLRRTDEGLRHILSDWAREHSIVVGGDVTFDAAALDRLPADMARRLLSGAITFVTGATYPPRAPSVMRILQAGDRPTTLAGCILYRHRDKLVVGREPARAAAAAGVTPGAVWDGRIIVQTLEDSPVTIRNLGAHGLAQAPDWRDLGHPRARLLASAGIWHDGTLVSAPLLDRDGVSTLKFVRDDFPRWLVSH